MIRRLLVWGSLTVLAACSARPPSLAEQAEDAADAARYAELGWLRYLQGDAEGAAAAFQRAKAEPLAALGRARLAKDRLDHEGTVRALVDANDIRLPAVYRLTGRWLADAQAQRRKDAKRPRFEASRFRRWPLANPRSTVRVSFLPWLDLPRLAATPPTVDENGQLQALGQVWALTKGRGRPDPDGIVVTVWDLPETPVCYYVQAPGPHSFQVPDARILLRVEGPMIAWRGGAEVFRSRWDRFAADWVEFDAPGRGPLVVAWASRRRPQDWSVEGDPWRPPARAPAVNAAVLAELAVLRGDAERAQALLSNMPEAPGFAGLRARLADLTPGRPQHKRRDAAKAHWQALLPLAPARAHMALARIALSQGEAGDAEAHVRAVLKGAPKSHQAWRLLSRVLLSQGRGAAAGRALGEALRFHPDPCKLLPDRAALGDDAPGDDDPVKLALRCERPLDAAQKLLDRHRPGEALAVLDEAEAKGPKARRLRARALLGLGRLDDAKAALGKGASADDVAQLIDLTPTDEPLAGLDALVTRFPHANLALDWIAAQPTLAEFAPLVLDTEAAIAAFEDQVPLPGPAVRVLDHSVLLFSKGGKRLRWVHEVLAIRSRDAAETYGEIGLPQGTRIVSLYTRKKDGRIRHGEEVPEKDSITLPELEAGDYVVAQYLEPGDNGYLYDKGFLSPRVFFQGVDLPIHRQRFEVYGPDDTPPDVQALAGAPKPQPVKLGARAGWRIEVRKVDQVVQEPDLPPAGRWLPSARAGRKVSLSDDLAYLRDRALARRRKTLAFEAWVREHAGDGERPAQVRRLARAVREAVDDQLGLIEEDAARAVETGNGNRALVLSAALEVLGVPHTLWQARPAVHVPPGPFTQVADFPYPLIFWAGGVLDPGPERADLGFMPFTLVGGDGVQVWPVAGAPKGPHPLPAPRTVHDRRRVRVEAEWGEDGVLRGEVVDRLEGQEAIVIGHHLSRLDPEQRPRLVERLLVAAVGAAKVSGLEDPTAQDPDGPLVLRYRFEAKVGDQLGMALFPAAPGRSHAPLPERALPLYVSLPTDQQVTWVLASDRDFACPPKAPVRLAHGPHRFVRTVECDGDDLTVTSEVVVAGGELAPDAYGAFARWARQVDEAERLRLTITESP